MTVPARPQDVDGTDGARSAGTRPPAVAPVTAAVIHDEILSALVSIVGPDRNSAATADQAAAALAVLARDRRDPSDDRPFVDRLTSLVEAEGHGAALTVERAGRAVEPDPEAATALLAATAEALRNVGRHVLPSVPDAARWVRLRQSHHHLRLEIGDRGPGFDPDLVDLRRLGLRHSVTGRMAAVPGGSVRIESSADHGTRIVLRWESRRRRPDPEPRIGLRASLSGLLLVRAASFRLINGGRGSGPVPEGRPDRSADAPRRVPALPETTGTPEGSGAQHLAVVADLAGELLRRAERGGLTDADAAEARVVEAMVRDRLRAPRLAEPPLSAAVRAARDRGVDVVLMDDGDPAAPLSTDRTARLLDLLGSCGAGTRVTIRLLPPGRAWIGSISMAGPAVATLDHF